METDKLEVEFYILIGQDRIHPKMKDTTSITSNVGGI